MLSAFSAHRVSDSLFHSTTGYGYDDKGRDTLELVFADVFGAQKALVRIQFVNGTHAIGCALFGAVKPGRTLISAVGAPYDTIRGVIGISGNHEGSLRDYGIGYRQVDTTPEGLPNEDGLRAAVRESGAGAVLIQRSRGYSSRKSLPVETIGRLCRIVKEENPGINVVVDNCYGEFVETMEPAMVGADLVAGSLIKNPGGWLAPGGGYVIGREDLVSAASMRLSVPGIGGECGGSLGQNRLLYQGLFMAPHTVAQALKTAVFCASLMELMGFETTPRFDAKRSDIVQQISFGTAEPLLRFCRGIQAGSPVDSFASPEPWDMPGYDCPIVMAAGAFIQGSSIELSCDAPMREPYAAYMQGGLTYESGKLGVMRAADRILRENG